MDDELKIDDNFNDNGEDEPKVEYAQTQPRNNETEGNNNLVTNISTQENEYKQTKKGKSKSKNNFNRKISSTEEDKQSKRQFYNTFK